jgi:hypothetical protein
MKKFNPEIWLVKREPFNPAQWLYKPAIKKQPGQFSRQKTTTCIQQEVEIVVRRIEAHQIDLTMGYEDWLKQGFALASEFGEMGRDYFQRISRFNGGYDMAKCNRQFDKCLNGRKSGITIKTFFAAAYNAGVNVRV